MNRSILRGPGGLQHPRHLITGGVAMGIFFFVFRIIFPEGEKSAPQN